MLLKAVLVQPVYCIQDQFLSVIIRAVLRRAVQFPTFGVNPPTGSALFGRLRSIYLYSGNHMKTVCCQLQAIQFQTFIRICKRIVCMALPAPALPCAHKSGIHSLQWQNLFHPLPLSGETGAAVQSYFSSLPGFRKHIRILSVPEHLWIGEVKRLFQYQKGAPFGIIQIQAPQSPLHICQILSLIKQPGLSLMDKQKRVSLCYKPFLRKQPESGYILRNSSVFLSPAICNYPIFTTFHPLKPFSETTHASSS